MKINKSSLIQICFALLIFSKTHFAMVEEPDLLAKISNEMKGMILDPECHINTLNLVKNLREKLPSEEFQKIDVLVLYPSEGHKYLPNSHWFFHVALQVNDTIFDFFNKAKSEQFLGQNLSDYLMENFFDFRKVYKNIVGALDPGEYKRFPGFSSVHLIDANRMIGIQALSVAAFEYEHAIKDRIIYLGSIKNFKTCRLTCYSYDKRAFLMWYKKRYAQGIDEADTMLLWSDLTELHFEALEHEGPHFENLCEQITLSFEWPALMYMQKRWQSKRLSTKKYFDTVRQRAKAAN